MNICSKCGHELKEGEQLCLHCGEKTPELCKECGHPLQEDMLFCAKCGTKRETATEPTEEIPAEPKPAPNIPKQVPKQMPKQYPKPRPQKQEAEAPAPQKELEKKEKAQKRSKAQELQCPRCRSQKVFTLESAAPGRRITEALMVCAECEYTFQNPLLLGKQLSAKKTNAWFFGISALLALIGLVFLLIQSLLLEHIAVLVLGCVALLLSVVPLATAIVNIQRLSRKLTSIYRC